MTGTATRKTEPHQKCSSKAPPTSGPMAAPRLKLAIHTPIANVRCLSSANMPRRSESVEGASVAPAIPSNALAAISIGALDEKAASSDAAPNATAPMSSRRRRPMRSPRLPMVRSKPASMNP